MNPTARTVVALGAAAGVLILLGQLVLLRTLAPASAGGFRPTPPAAGTTTIDCTPVDQLATHYHVALLIHHQGVVDVLPAQTGIEDGCIYWIHTHDDSGIVHIEAPASYQDHVFVLGDAFNVAGMRLDDHHLGSESFAGGKVAVYVNGVRWAGAPGSAPLIEADTIDVVAPGESYRYQAFDWPPGFVAPPAV